MNALLPEELFPLAREIGNKFTIKILFDLDSPKYKKEINNPYSHQAFNERLLRMRKFGLIESRKDIFGEIIKRTNFGDYVTDVYKEIVEKQVGGYGYNMLCKKKYKRNDYDELYKMQLQEKVLRLQGTLARIIRDKNPVVDKATDHKRPAFRLLNMLVMRLKSNFNLSTKNKEHILLSIKTIHENPEIFDEWAVAGCYNPKTSVAYPLAIWNKDECIEYLKILNDNERDKK